MGILKQLFGNKSIPLSNVYGRYLSPIITHTDSLDFYTSWIWACVDQRAKALARVNFRLYKLNRNGEVEEVEQHELLSLLQKCNQDMTKFDFLELSSIYRDLLGASPIFLDYQGGRLPQAMYLVRPEYLKINRNQDGTVASYTYQLGSYRKSFLPDEIIMLKNYNPKDPDKGLGTIEAVRQTAEQDDYMLQNNSRLLQNEARPSGILKLTDKPNKEDLKNLERKFTEKYGGFDNAGKVQILTGGMEFQPLSITPKDLDYIESQKFSKDKILSIFGVPPELLGNLQNANRASAEAVLNIFYKITIEPIVEKYVEQLNEFLVPKFGEDLLLGFDPLSREDEELTISKVNLLTDKVFTKNEARQMFGYDPIEGGDTMYQDFSKVPLGADMGGSDVKSFTMKNKSGISGQKDREIKIKILNRNLKLKRQINDITNNIMSGIKVAGGTKYKIVKAHSVKAVEPKKKEVYLFKKSPKINAEVRQKFQTYTLKEEDRINTKWEREMKRYFAKQKAQLLDYVEEKYNIKSFSIHKFEKAFEREGAIESLITIIDPIYYDSVMSGIAGAEKYFAPEDYLKTTHNYDMVKLWAKKTAMKYATDITDTTIISLVSVITSGIEEGLGIQEVKEGIQKIFDTMTDTRATMIARTETARAFSEAHYRAYKEMGYNKVAWLLHPTETTCDECISNSKEHWDINEIKDTQPVHPNCLCDFAPLD